MEETVGPVQIPRSFMTDMPAATMHAGMVLMSRRSGCRVTSRGGPTS